MYRGYVGLKEEPVSARGCVRVPARVHACARLHVHTRVCAGTCVCVCGGGLSVKQEQKAKWWELKCEDRVGARLGGRVSAAGGAGWKVGGRGAVGELS